jgi:hypothetical protein
VAAEMGVSLVPASMNCLKKPGIVFRSLSGKAPTAKLSAAYRRDGNLLSIRNFLRHIFD